MISPASIKMDMWVNIYCRNGFICARIIIEFMIFMVFYMTRNKQVEKKEELFT